MTSGAAWRRWRVRASLLVLAGVVVLAPRVSAQEKGLASVLDTWTGAVVHHTPGVSDSTVSTVWAMTPADREIVRGNLTTLVFYMNGGDFSHARGDAVVVAAVAASLRPLSSSEFLKRAAILHADAAMFDHRPPQTLTPKDLPSRTVGRRGESGPAIFYTSTDGEYLQAFLENANWPLARLMLDTLPPGAASQAFATTWYHGVTAHLLAEEDFGEAETNLDHGTRALPDSAAILADLGCVAEALGMNMFQQVALDDNDPLFRGRPGVISAPQTTTSAKARDAQAASLFERALALDPHLPEARVRWARLLELDHRWAEATQQVTLALADQPDRVLTFYAHLLGARAANARNDATVAEAHVSEALKLFPHAESALLEASDTALRRSDPGLAKSRLTALADRGRDAALTSDPWLEYHLGPGRLPDPPLQALWHAVPASVR